MSILDDSIFKVLITVPDRDSENEWVFPNFWRWWYFGSLAITLIAEQLGFLYLAWYWSYAVKLPVGKFMLTMIGTIICCTLGLLIECIVTRITYETTILLFHVFRGQRDTVKAVENLERSLSTMAQVQISSGQYVCDRLAEICDELKGVKE